MIGVRINSLSEVEAEVRRCISSVPLAAATAARKIIQENSDKGDDIKGRKMVKYSSPYEKWRQRHGLTTNPPNLRVRGVLLYSANVKAEGMRSSLEPSPDRRIIAEGNLRYRKFYPESDADVQQAFINKIITYCEKSMVLK